MRTDLELFELLARMSYDNRGRIRDSDGVTVAAAHDGGLVFVGSKITDEVDSELRALSDGHPVGGDPAVEPAVVGHFKELLEERVGPTAVRSGPYYVVPRRCTFTSDAEIHRSTDAVSDLLRRGNPGNWEPQEWEDLLDNKLDGPWAMAVTDGRVVSICHTPRVMSEEAAECGAWTDPAYRGRGYAAATVAAWAEILHPTGRELFYSTDAENKSSQRVAERLRLRLIGWTWNLEPSRTA